MQSPVQVKEGFGFGSKPWSHRWLVASLLCSSLRSGPWALRAAYSLSAPRGYCWGMSLNRTRTWGFGQHWSNFWQQKVTSELQSMPKASFKGGKGRLNTERDVRGDVKIRIGTPTPPVEVLTRDPGMAGQLYFIQACLLVLIQLVPGLVTAEHSFMETWRIPKKNSTNLNNESKCNYWAPLVFHVPHHLSL